jgi:hypothetical protein
MLMIAQRPSSQTLWNVAAPRPISVTCSLDARARLYRHAEYAFREDHARSRSRFASVAVGLAVAGVDGAGALAASRLCP